MYIVYCITNKINNKKYIGQSVESLKKRWSRHLSETIKRDYIFSRALRKYSEENWTQEILQDNIESLDESNIAEVKWIEYYKTYVSKYGNAFGYNATPGGKVYEFSPEIKEKIRQSKLGEKNNFYGKHHTEETKKLISKNSSEQISTQRKFNEEQVKEIRNKYEIGGTYRGLGREYNTDKEVIKKIVKRIYYRNIE